MAKKDNKAKETPAKTAKEAKKTAMTPEEKAAKRKARMEAIKNRPAGQRPNSKQIDVIVNEDGSMVKTFGYPIKQKNVHVGVLVTVVAYDKDGKPVSTSSTFVPGDLTVKCKKEHGVICGAKHKGEAAAEDEEEDDAED